MIDLVSQFAEIQKRLQTAMQPIADMHRQLRAAAEQVVGPIAKLIEAQQRVVVCAQTFMPELQDFWAKLARASRHSGALEKAGWLPHYTTPFNLIEEYGEDTEALQARLRKYYDDNWYEIRSCIEARLGGYDLDEEAKETLREALAAHGAGFHRSVCRLLFPEIERIARVELYGDRLGHITSQLELQKLAGNLTPGSIEPRGFYSLSLFRRLTEHLYEQVNNEADRKRCAEDALPNRHAALHGLVIYSSVESSLNTIFMTEYLFQVIDFLKKRARNAASA